MRLRCFTLAFASESSTESNSALGCALLPIHLHLDSAAYEAWMERTASRLPPRLCHLPGEVAGCRRKPAGTHALCVATVTRLCCSSKQSHLERPGLRWTAELRVWSGCNTTCVARPSRLASRIDQDLRRQQRSSVSPEPRQPPSKAQ